MTTPSRFSLAIALSMASFSCLVAASRAADLVLIDYEQPKLLRGTIYETGSGTNKVLFTFKRTSARSNSTVQVTRDFSYPDGSLAARETVVFERGQLVSFELDDRQTGARGSATVRTGKSKGTLVFSWTTGREATDPKKTDSEKLQPDTLVGDMIPYFVTAHWNELSRGNTVHFRFIAEAQLETVGFKLVREAETAWHGIPVIRLRMEPSNVLIRQLVDPLFFTVEKNGAHRILEYTGRTTPKTRDGSKWKDLDARTIYHWNQEGKH